MPNRFMNPSIMINNSKKPMLLFFLQMWTNWGLNFESTLSSTDQKNPADFNAADFTEIYIGTFNVFRIGTGTQNKQRSMADLTELLSGKSKAIFTHYWRITAIFFLKSCFPIFSIFSNPQRYTVSLFSEYLWVLAKFCFKVVCPHTFVINMKP